MSHVERNVAVHAQGGDGEPAAPPPAEGRIIAALVSAGLSGTCAVLGAAAAKIDLGSMWRWGATDDFALALGLASGVVALEAALFGPRWDLLLAGAGRPGARPGAVGLQLKTGGVGSLLSADSLVAALVLEQACWVAAQVVRGRGGAPPGPDGRVPPEPAAAAVTDVGLVLVREAAKELLQRGLVFTFLATWLTDRAFEAGADDLIGLASGPLASALLSLGGASPALGAAAAAGSVAEVYLPDAVRWATAALVTASLVPPVLNEAEALRLGVASNLALVEVSQLEAADERMQAEQVRRKAAAAAANAAVAEIAAASSPAGAASDAPGSGVADSEDGSGSEEGGGGGKLDEGDDDEELEGMLREYRLVEALGRSTATGPPRLTYALTLLRGLLRFGSVNLAFALTGNLAATLAASALPNLLLLAYVRAGPKVLLERPPPPTGKAATKRRAASAATARGAAPRDKDEP
ncbi:hypothetical protein CHLRE_07g331850v5 [Chlamydomonas reinhardtii]|uniref:Uncharacterized protein n=1 Tax=Chlamydomonas reinhardtii TaxID=3055 RepID=A0A2K3DJY4_CHLRE|nr:uncharacterized protein CHLRE_07g331850v5 [Chlamydomonas reinhardtii]PNW80842.1 hypothetical protein CHLRE_07g331850v5 [Chlamydomonas reinhardtii]